MSYIWNLLYRGKSEFQPLKTILKYLLSSARYSFKQKLEADEEKCAIKRIYSWVYKGKKITMVCFIKSYVLLLLPNAIWDSPGKVKRRSLQKRHRASLNNQDRNCRHTEKGLFPTLLASQGLTEIRINVASAVFFFTPLNADSESPGKACKNRHISEHTDWNWKQVIRTEGKKTNSMLVSWRSCRVSATSVFLELDSSSSAVQSLHPQRCKYCSTSAQRTALGSTF